MWLCGLNLGLLDPFFSDGAMHHAQGNLVRLSRMDEVALVTDSITNRSERGSGSGLGAAERLYLCEVIETMSGATYSRCISFERAMRYATGTAVHDRILP